MNKDDGKDRRSVFPLEGGQGLALCLSYIAYVILGVFMRPEPKEAREKEKETEQ